MKLYQVTPSDYISSEIICCCSGTKLYQVTPSDYIRNCLLLVGDKTVSGYTIGLYQELPAAGRGQNCIRLHHRTISGIICCWSGTKLYQVTPSDYIRNYLLLVGDKTRVTAFLNRVSRYYALIVNYLHSSVSLPVPSHYLPYTQTQTHTNTHTHTHKHTHTHTHKHTQTHTHRHTQTHTHTHTHTHIHTHTHSYTHTHTHTQTHTNTHTHTHTHTYTHTLIHTHTHTHTHVHTQRHRHRHTHCHEDPHHLQAIPTTITKHTTQT